MTALHSKDGSNLQVLTSFPSEFGAGPVVDALKDNGIRSEAVGGYTAGFIAEAPGSVSILVREADLPDARKVLAQIEKELGAIDWESVDVGDDEDAIGEAEAEKAEEDVTGHREPLQFSIASLLAVQTLIAVVFGLLLGPAAGLVGIVGVAVIVAATVYAGSDLQRTRKVWGHFGRAMTVGMVIWLVMVLGQIAWEAILTAF